MDIHYLEQLDQELSHQRDSYISLIQKENGMNPISYIILDDDPTGTQTVHGVPVLTTWSKVSLVEELTKGTPLFFILTNSRSLPVDAAQELAFTIGKNIRWASKETGRDFRVISRGDSTLRGHYPQEVTTLEKGLGALGHLKIMAPAFFEGGRFTLDDIHYVLQGEKLIPAGDTVFAKDKAFGYSASHLKEWIIEKSQGTIVADSIHSFSLTEIRDKGPEGIAEKLKKIPRGSTCIVNAIQQTDLEAFVLGLLKSRVPYIGRTAASFVAALGGITARPLLTGDSILNPEGKGILFVVGSYVPKTTAQIDHLRTHTRAKTIEVDVEEVLKTKDRLPLLEKIGEELEARLRRDELVIIYTSRQLITGSNAENSLAKGNTISHFLTEIIASLHQLPRLLVAKGGITSSDIATKSLQVTKATVLGQVLPGVPVWKLGDESKFPDLNYIIFPGNVGEENALTTIAQQTMIKTKP